MNHGCQQLYLFFIFRENQTDFTVLIVFIKVYDKGYVEINFDISLVICPCTHSVFLPSHQKDLSVNWIPCIKCMS